MSENIEQTEGQPVQDNTSTLPDLDAAKKAIREAGKEVTKLRKEYERAKRIHTYAHSIEIWKQVTEIREQAEQEIQDLIEREKDKLIAITANKVKGDFNKYYTYQHPDDGYQNLRGNDPNADWIKAYLAANPKRTLADLAKHASDTRYNSFIASFKRTRKTTKKEKKSKDSKETTKPAIDPTKRVQ